MLKDPYLKEVYLDTVERNKDQAEFLQAVREVFESLEPYVEMCIRDSGKNFRECSAAKRREITFPAA